MPTVVTQNNFTGDGSTRSWAISFPYINPFHVKVYLAGVLQTTSYIWLNTTTIQFVTAPGNGVTIDLVRETPYDTPLAFVSGGVMLDPASLAVNVLQTLYVAQERVVAQSGVLSTNLSDRWDGQGKRLTNVGTAIDSADVPSYGQIKAVLTAANAAASAATIASNTAVSASSGLLANIADINANKLAVLEVVSGASLPPYVANLYEAISALIATAVAVNTTAITNLIKTVAYVNFDRTTPANVSASYTQSGQTVTVTLNDHNHKVGHFIFADNSTGGSATGGFLITGVLDANRFTYTSTNSLTTSGTLILKRCTVRSSKNIHSVYYTNTVGLTYINLDDPLTNTNYTTQYTVGNTVFNREVPIGDGSVIGQTALYFAVSSYTTNGTSFLDFPYNAVTIVQ
jgi:hypothetical protein